MKWNMLVGSLVLGASLCTPSFAGFGLLDRMLGLKGCGCDSTCCDTGCGAAPSCGCENACAADPSCGCESAPACGSGCGAAPSCGCESAPACGSGCGAAPSCGCESACGAAPSCGCESACAPSCGCETACCKPRRKPLLELLRAVECKKQNLISKLKSRHCGCDTGCEPTCGVDPSCGCESACAAPACGGCAAPSCGCEVATCDSGCGCGPKKCGLLSKLFKHKKSCCDTACDSCGVAASSCSSCGGGAAAPAVSGDAAPMPPAPVVDPSAYLQSNRRVIQATSYVR